MNRSSRILGVLFLISATPALAGPPFQTDDPEPIDFRHYEFCVFASSDGTPLETDMIGPGFEFNWGALPNVHLHIIVPGTAIFPSSAPRACGIGDIELGIKLRFIQETKHRPMVGTFTMFEVPSGNAARGLGLGGTWYKVPLWAQKSFGPWTTCAGSGVTVVSSAGYRNYPFAGWLVQRDIGRKVTLGTEVFYHGPEGTAAPQSRHSTLTDVGGYYKFRDPGFQLLSVMATRSLDKQKILPVSGSTGPGVRTKTNQATTPIRISRPVWPSTIWAPPGLMGHT